MSETVHGEVLIGELSRRTGVSRRSLRYYEQRGLLEVSRTGAGWRAYDEAAVRRVRNVTELLESGMTVQDIQQVAPCLDGTGPFACDRIEETIELHEARLRVLEARMDVLREHRDNLRRRITELRAHRDTR